MMVLKDIFETPIGPLLIIHKADTLLYLDFAENEARFQKLAGKRFGSLSPSRTAQSPLIKGLQDYFAGKITALNNISTEPTGTEFQQTVWQALRAIPCGQTLSYKALAQKIGNPKAVRAVARANALNPISLVHPCHRVIAEDGSLRGYAGGLERKQWLLAHETAFVRK